MCRWRILKALLQTLFKTHRQKHLLSRRRFQSHYQKFNMKKSEKGPKPSPKDMKVQNPKKQDIPDTEKEGFAITKKAGKHNYGGKK